MEGVPTHAPMSCLDSHVAVEQASLWTLTTRAVTVSQDYLDNFCLISLFQILMSVQAVPVETSVSTLMAVFIASVPPTLLWTLTVEVAYVRSINFCGWYYFNKWRYIDIKCIIIAEVYCDVKNGMVT